MPETHRCYTCGSVDAGEFYKDTRTKCKTCRKAAADSKTKACRTCGSTDPETFSPSQHTKCRTCTQQVQNSTRWRRRQAKEALKDGTVHNYGKGRLPPNFDLTGVSQLVGSDGEIKAQWLKSKANKESQAELLMEAMEDMLQSYEGVVPAAPVPEDCIDDLMTVVPLGDPHVGLHCWGEETGNDFDLKIAERNMRTAVKALFDAAPPAKQCMIINLGDYFHADSSKNKTTAGTDVDVDGRRMKVVSVGLDIFVNVIDQALLKHELVHVICVTGNHDGESSKMLALMLSKMYAVEPRVHIETAPTKYHRYRFGKVLIGTTHGDTGKDVDLGMIMATDWRADWAEAQYFHWYKGHVHHDTVKEYTGGVIVETFRTLAPADAWHTAQGYRSGRNLKLDVWHREWGHQQRHVIGIQKINHINKNSEE